MQPRTNSPFFALLCVACSALSACGGDDDGSDEPVGPSGPVELRIEGFMNNQGESFERDADEVVLSCDGSINVLFGPRSGADLENWVLRPPGACESFVQCGYIVLAATPEGAEATRTAGASTTLRVPVSAGVHRLDAVLYDGEDEEFLQDGEPVEDSLSGVEFSAPIGCAPATTSSGGTSSGGSSSGGTSSGGSSSGGFGGEGGAAGAAGAAGEAGAGGAAGAAQG